MIKLQMRYPGEAWEDTGNQWPAEHLAKKACETESFEELGNTDKYWKYEFRLIEGEKVLETYRFAYYNDAPTIAMNGENPLAEIQDAYNFEDSEMIEFCQRYLQAKTGVK